MDAAWLAAGLSLVGLAQALAGLVLLLRLMRRPRPEPSEPVPVTVLKPLYGEEPLLEAALASVCRQDYPEWQVVFGVQRPDDPALAAVRRVQALFPGCDIAVVVEPARHGANGKVGNLI